MSHTRYEVSFTGNVETYRPIWRKNMLLLLLTAGFALPWALVGSLRYFYQNTHVAGANLDYHANPWKMFAGNVIGTVILNAIYYGISLTGPYQMMGVAAMQILTAAFLPIGLHGFLEFQLMHTSWRGQRLSLAATPADAIKAMGLPTLLYIVGGVLAVWAVIAGMGGQRVQSYVLGACAAAALSVALPWVYVQFKRYQHRHAALGDWRNEQGQTFRPRDAMRVTLRTGLLALLALLLVILPLIWGLSELVGLDWETVARLKQNEHRSESIRLALVLVPGIFLGIVMMMALPYPYLSVQLQNRLWSDTAHKQIRFDSAVPEGELLKLTLRNWLLIGCTLGWYYPHAAISEARLRLRSVSVWIKPEVMGDLQDKPAAATS
ncbi:MAG TPA: DUF898 family protein [Aquabacterium sp.]|uniref:DUF898 family protein n=1 Tax=Aquabacterium sp. TaxID=1872578 RepID=UPI002E304243|nr:DUF898 family protein [Aquabacterium sp.]HEX5358201.1 DUF898 family protein [Aquabacterium sp.]